MIYRPPMPFSEYVKRVDNHFKGRVETLRERISFHAHCLSTPGINSGCSGALFDNQWCYRARTWRIAYAII